MDILSYVLGKASAGGGGGGLVYETGTFTPTEDIARPTIYFSGTHSKNPFFVGMFDMVDELDLSYTNVINAFSFVYPHILWGKAIAGNIYANKWGFVCSNTRDNNTGNAVNMTMLLVNSERTSTNSNADVGYYVSPEWFKPRALYDTYKWKAGKTYQWIAIWN